MASAYLGTTFMPPLVGLIGRFAGFDVMPIFLLIFVAVMISMTEKTFRMTRK
jgi:hypothetical protein